MASAPTWSPTQRARLDQWRVPRSVDCHCHCLPGMDDGPPSLDQALDLCRSLVADGVTTVVATPHQLGRYDHMNTAGEIRLAVAGLAEELRTAEIPLELTAGGDVRLDERLLKLLDADEVLTAADAHRHVLLELPHDVFLDPLPAIHALRGRGLQAIMSHPERHRYLLDAPQRVDQWIDAGAVLQITAGSLLGDFGPLARQESWRLIHAGLVSLVATDAHDAARRPPRMTAALDLLQQEAGDDVARAVCLANPNCVLDGVPLKPPPGA